MSIPPHFLSLSRLGSRPGLLEAASLPGNEGSCLHVQLSPDWAFVGITQHWSLEEEVIPHALLDIVTVLAKHSAPVSDYRESRHLDSLSVSLSVCSRRAGLEKQNNW